MTSERRPVDESFSHSSTTSDEAETGVSGGWPITDEFIQQAVASVIQSGDWGRYRGSQVAALRKELAAFHAVEHLYLTCSGTAAVELALRGAGVGEGDEVILCAYDFKSNFMNVLALGAVPVLVDSLPGIPMLNPERFEAAVTPRTRAVICSHLHGCLADISAVRSLIADRSIRIVEDACQNPGALRNGVRAGAMGDVGVLSFGGSKLLTSGRGGAVLTNEASIFQRIRLHVHRGNDAYPLSELQAAVLRPQLRQLDERNVRRLAAVRAIADSMAESSSLKLVLPPELASYSTPVGNCDVSSMMAAFYKLGFELRSARDRSDTESFTGQARQSGIPVDCGFPALHLTHSRRRFRTMDELAAASQLHHGLLVMHHPILLDEESRLRDMITRLVELAASCPH